jgi:hypothetical protein
MSQVQRKLAKNTSILREEHYGKWVAFSADQTKVIDFADTLKQLAAKVGDKKAIFSKAVDPSKTYAF